MAAFYVFLFFPCLGSLEGITVRESMGFSGGCGGLLSRSLLFSVCLHVHVCVHVSVISLCPVTTD